MKLKGLIIFSTLLMTFAVSGAAQDRKAEPDTDAGRVERPADIASRDAEIAPLANTSLEAALKNTVDVRRSKVGDAVTLKTTKSVKQDGEVVVPKGTLLTGRITELVQKGDGSGVSKIGMVIDRIEGRGLASPITASIVSITDARAGASIADTAMADSSGSSATRTSTSRGSSGGLLGGAVGGVVNTATQTAGTVTGTAASTVGSAAGALGGTLRGVQISQSASGSANGSATLTSNDKNFRIEKGATFNLLVTGSTTN